MRRTATLALAASLLGAPLLPLATASARTGSPSVSGTARGVRVRVAASGLDAPKNLLFARRRLLVVESGAGGRPAAANCVTGPATEGPGTTSYCVGETGAVALVAGGRARVLLHLPSAVAAGSGEVSGPAAVAYSGGNRAALVFQDTLVAATGVTALPAPAKRLFGTLLLSSGHRAPLARFAAAHPQATATLGGLPGETPYDSDPYDVVAYRGGFAVVDAAANSLLTVSATGRIHLLARFPTYAETVPAGVLGPVAVTVAAQAVPTAVAVGPDGALYVGELRGVPSLPGTAFVYRVVPGHAATLWARGLTAVTAMTFDRRGRLLATELSTGGLLAPATVPGALVRVSRDGRRVATMPVSGLVDPTGVAVGPDGAVYVSNHGTSVATSATPGQVLRITGLA